MIQRRTCLSFALACLLGLGGCAAHGGSDEDDAPQETRRIVVHVLVDNRNWADVTVYVLRGGARARLGTVTSMNTVRFVVPAVISGSTINIRLLADPVGATAGFTSQSIRVEAGDQVEWLLANKLDQSSLSVF